MYRSKYVIECSPEPPDFIVRSEKSGKRTWIEITSAFMSKEWARDVTSYASTSEVHRPISYSVVEEPDKLIAQEFTEVVQKKLNKDSYKNFVRDIGLGYLIVPLMYPLLTHHTFNQMRQTWVQTGISLNRSAFRSIYIGWGNHEKNTRFKRW